MSLTHLSLFSGIGGIDLAAEWAGFETVAFVEKDPFCQQVLAKYWPGVPIFDDITTFDATKFGRLALVSGGFPCQDISCAGLGGGLDGGRSGLWFEMLRVVRESRPLFVLAENVGSLRTRGIDRMLDGLAEAGYTAEPFVVGAGNAGAPHLRRRCFVVATNADRLRELQSEGRIVNKRGRSDNGIEARGMVTNRPKFGRYVPSAESMPIRSSWKAGTIPGYSLPWRDSKPPVPGMVDGVPRGVDRIRALGNTVVPQQVYPILKAIADHLRAIEAGA